MDLRTKRVYEEASPDDGARILVDRLWPRGVSKDRARLDAWMREIAPSDALRTWFAHDPAKWDAFLERYATELDANRDLVAELERRLRDERVTLLYSARDTRHNQAVALERYLRKRNRA
ncbi:MAG: DUF488 family protein [Gemmatimonadetes bacterium]|nr:DUF488 family protein [Gemmatimonadota bacterium]